MSVLFVMMWMMGHFPVTLCLHTQVHWLHTCNRWRWNGCGRSGVVIEWCAQNLKVIDRQHSSNNLHDNTHFQLQYHDIIVQDCVE